MSTAPAQPSWLDTPCPEWCVRRHLEHDHPDDRLHQSEASVVPGVAGVPSTDGLRRRLATDLVVVASQHVDEESPWVRIETADHGGPRLVLSAETMQLVLSEAASLVESLRAS